LTSRPGDQKHGGASNRYARFIPAEHFAAHGVCDGGIR